MSGILNLKNGGNILTQQQRRPLGTSLVIIGIPMITDANRGDIDIENRLMNAINAKSSYEYLIRIEKSYQYVAITGGTQDMQTTTFNNLVQILSGIEQEFGTQTSIKQVPLDKNDYWCDRLIEELVRS